MGEYLDEAFDMLMTELRKSTPSNELFVRYGIAVQTLDNFREDLNITIPERLESEFDLCTALIHQIRNCFAHAIVRPVWRIPTRYRLVYEFEDISISLVSVNGQEFDFDHVGGASSLLNIRKAFEDRI